MLYEQFGELKYKYRNREFCCRGYNVDNLIEFYIRLSLEVIETRNPIDLQPIGKESYKTENIQTEGGVK